MSAPDRIGQLLLQAKLLDRAELLRAQTHRSQWGGSLHRIVVELGFAREEQVAQAIANGFQLKRVSLAPMPPDPAALAVLTASFCEEHNVFPCAVRDGGRSLWLAMSDPGEIGTVDEVARTSRLRVGVVVAGYDEIQEAILRNYRGEQLGSRDTGAGGLSFESAEDEEFKLVDSEGKTMMRSLDELRARAAAAPPNPMQQTEAALEELLGLAHAGALNEEELRRLAQLQELQTRSAQVLRALIELCVERGIFDLNEYRGRVRPS